jgi:hypothetical protein
LLFIGIHNAWDAVAYHVFVNTRDKDAESGRKRFRIETCPASRAKCACTCSHSRRTALIGERTYARSLPTLRHLAKPAGQVRKYCSPFRRRAKMV